MRKMKKILLSTTVILLVSGVSSAFASREHPSVFINSEKMDIYANVTSLGTTLVPMRPIFEAYGMTVKWDNSAKSVTATKDDTTIKLTDNSYDAYLNGKLIKLNQAPSLEPTSSIFYVNLRFISESLGAKVNWSTTADDASININFPS
ncbi:copper amine oxidase N-terminal domain-containing protein [Paenibacillus sp. FSL R7-0204]|uniref:copper amine oxidase N-terminal domain-containing protein n=1 Tax=Paenibacillus sp. FSL R7-0204 TaxID=2921675 RepID=UPI0030FC861B